VHRIRAVLRSAQILRELWLAQRDGRSIADIIRSAA
jgi:hypothetical protein